MTGYELKELVKALVFAVVDPEITDERRAELAAQLAEVDAEVEEKAEAYVHVIKRLESEAEIQLAESNRIKYRSMRLTEDADRLRQRLADLCLETGRGKIEMSFATVNVTRNGWIYVKAKPADIPDDYVTIGKPPRTANKTLLREALEKGEATEYAEFRHTVTVK